MNLKIFLIVSLLAVSAIASGQTDQAPNLTDQQGRKQGRWITRYSNGNIRYEGTFKDNQPVGEFKRYYENSTLSSILVYRNNGNDADALLFYPNGYISAYGKYINRLKEGKWQFFSSSAEGYLINEEMYHKNLRNGISLKFYTDSTIAEKVNYINDRKEGEWLQYYASGKVFIKSNYTNGLLNGKFEVWFEDGKPEITGIYKNNFREGKWLIYSEDGTIKYELNYTAGVTKDRQMDIDAAMVIDNMEKNKGTIPDPEKSSEIRQ
jgi:antitoxin component YwqK of YwqJK toxin-antitoxin module